MIQTGTLACAVIGLAIGFGARSSSAQHSTPNLVTNGGFEQGAEGWRWGQWKGLPEPGYVDQDAPYAGEACYTMTLAGIAGERLLYTTVPNIDPASDYELSFVLRGTGLPENSIGVSLLQWGTEKSEKVKPQGWVTVPDRPSAMNLFTTGGTFKWRFCNVHVYQQGIKPSTKRLTLYIRHSAIGTGELGIDDVALVAVAPVPYRGPAAQQIAPAPAAAKLERSSKANDTDRQPAASKAETRELLLDRCDSAKGWVLQLGKEFPGAAGELTAATDGGRDVIKTIVDLTGGGRYAGAERNATLERAEAILFELQSSGLRNFGVRIRDTTGQTHAASFQVEPGAWRAIELPMTKKTFTSHWGGAKDGKILFPLRRVLISANPSKGGKGEFLLRNFGVRRVAPKQTWGITVATDQPGHIHFPEEATVKVAVRVLNRLRENRTVSVAVQVVDFDGKAVATRKDVVRFAAWAPETANLPVEAPGHGYFHVQVTVGTGPSAEHGEGAFGVVPRPLRYREGDPDSFFGMHSVTPDIAARIGVHWYRYYRNWKYAELHRGMIDSVAERLQRCVDGGIDIMMCLNYREPSWLKLRTGPDGLPTDEALRRYADFVRFSVREHSCVAAFEIQNEPDLELMAHRNLPLDKGVEFYARLVKTVAPIVRKEAPGVPVVGANVSGQDQKSGFPFCRGVFDQVGDQFDVWAPHPYASPRTFGPGLAPLFPEDNKETAKHLETLALIRKTGRNHKYWIGEKGWEIRDEASLTGHTARAFADCAARSLIIAKSVPGVEKYFWFVLAQEYKVGSKYTLFRGKPLQPMPGAIAYANLAYHLDHAQPVESLQLAGGRIRACVFERKSTNTAIAALWCVSTPFVLDAKLPDSARVLDLYGRPLPGPQLGLSETPLFVQVSAAQVNALVAGLENARFAAAQPFTVAAAHLRDVRTLHLGLLNNTSRVVRVEATAGTAQGKTALLPGRETPVPLDIVLGQPVTTHSAEALSVTVTPREGKPVELTIPTNLLTITHRQGIVVDGRAEDWNGVTPIVLNARHQVLPPDEAGWNGPDDLSMRVTLAWDTANLFLLVRVTDDIHATPNSVQFWKSDALQIGVDIMNDAGDVPSYDANDHEYGAMVDSRGAHAYQTHPKGDPNFRVAGARDEGRNETLYEMAFTWSDLGREPTLGLVFSLNVIATDNDGARMNYWIGLSPGIVEGKRPGEYRDFYLAE